MRVKEQKGSVLIMVIFVVALLSAVVMGMLQMNTEEIQVMENHIRAAEAIAVAEAGLNDAMSQLLTQADWAAGFENKSFDEGTYTVTVDGTTITSIGTSSRGFVACVEAEVTVASEGPPYIVEIDNIKVNQ